MASPIMTYGGDDEIPTLGGMIFGDGGSGNTVLVIIVILVLMYWMGMFDNMTECFYIDLESQQKLSKRGMEQRRKEYGVRMEPYYDGGLVYDEPYLTYEGGEESMYSGKDGFGRNY